MTGVPPVLRPWRGRMGMELPPMQYKRGSCGPHNPRTYTITHDRQVAVHKVPLSPVHMQDLGMGHRVMQGRGVCGAGATTPSGPGLGVLGRPGTFWLRPWVYFVALALTQEPRKDHMCGTPLPSGRPTAATWDTLAPGRPPTRGAPLRPRVDDRPGGPDPYGGPGRPCGGIAQAWGGLGELGLKNPS